MLSPELTPALATPRKRQMEVVPFEAANTLVVHRWHGGSHVIAVYHFGDGIVSLTLSAKQMGVLSGEEA
jgi:hypothetical protein